MNLDELFRYKDQVINDIITDEDIVKLINPNSTLASASGLVYTQIFPFEYLPSVADEGKTFVCVEMDISVHDKNITIPDLYIWVFTHKSLMRLDTGGVRVDNICHKICKKINGSKYYGMGSLEFRNTKRFAPISDYQGRLMIFTTSDWNRVFNPNASIPSRRGLNV